MAGKRFGGKVALVTGAASGIGLETARALAAEGATLVLCDGRGELDAPYRRRDVSAAGVAARTVRAAAEGRSLVPVAADARGPYLLKRLPPGALEWPGGVLSERFDPSRRHRRAPPRAPE